MRMRPLPETVRAEDLWGPFLWDGADLLEHFVDVSGRVRELAPECVGMSLSLREEGVTFTLVATSEDVALLDAGQYLDGGPCVDALESESRVEAADPALVEEQWRLHASVTAARGVGSTLSLPVVKRGEAVAGFNLYGLTSSSFVGRHDQLADALGAWATGAVTNSDLTFHSRDLARRSAGVLEAATGFTVAAATLARTLAISQGAAEERLRQAALRAAVPLATLAEHVLDVLRD